MRLKRAPDLPLCERLGDVPVVHKNELRALLTHHRGVVSPESRGLPPRAQGRGRPVTGLSQEQMDVLLTVTDMAAFPILGLLGVRGGWVAGMYARLERGRLVYPPPEFLDDVALLLGMDEHARILLWRYQGDIAPVRQLRPDGGGRTGPDMQPTLDRLGQVAYTTDSSFRLLQWNRLALEMFPPESVVGGRPPANCMEFTLWGARDTFHIQWDLAWRPLALMMLRDRVQGYPGDPELLRVEARVLADPTLAPMYRDPALDAVIPDGRPQPMCHGRLGPGWARLIFGQLRGADGDFMIIDFEPTTEPIETFADSWTRSA